MDIKRKVFFAIVAAAMLLNISYGFANNGIPIPLIIDQSNDPSIDEEIISLDIPAMRSGDIYRSSYNMSVAATIQEEDWEETGSYEINGLITRSIVNDRILKDLGGQYSVKHNYNETEDVFITGEMERNAELIFNGDGNPLDEKVETRVTISGPKGMGSSSKISAINSEVTSLRPDMIWQALVPENGTITIDHEGSVSTEVNLQEAGISIGDVVLTFETISIFDEIDGRKALISAYTEIGSNGELDISLKMKDGCPWPESIDIDLNGVFITEEGPAVIGLKISEELEDHSIGGGQPLPMRGFNSLGPEYTTSTDDTDIMPEEGGDTELRSNPEQAFDLCMEKGVHLKQLIDENGMGSISLLDLKYSRNDTRDRMWTWNITVASPPVDGISDTVTFLVGVEGGGLLDQTRSSLISEVQGSRFRYPTPERELISLHMNEERLKGSSFKDHFFIGNDHSPSYELDILRRGDGQCDMASILFMNMLGFQKAQVKDLFISSAIDISDPSIMYILVVNGNSGEVLSTAEIHGAGVTMLKNYGFDLA
jgi:hypothetical protein